MTGPGPGPQAVARELADLLPGWTRAHPDQATAADEYRGFIAQAGASAVDRDLGRAHLTASAFVLSPDLAQVLLCFHRKGGFWVQLGGHVEPADASLRAAALREAREEGGITDLRPISPDPLDLDRHHLGEGFVRCDTHWDVGFGFTAPDGAVPVVSEESLAVRWWPADALPQAVPSGFAERLRRALGAARSAVAPAPERSSVLPC